VLPGDDGPASNSLKQILPVLRISCLLDFLREIEVIPADDGVFDQPFAAFGDLLFVFFCLSKFSGKVREHLLYVQDHYTIVEKE